MLKQLVEIMAIAKLHPAAFRRLCVETGCADGGCDVGGPAAFRRLCVETKRRSRMLRELKPAAFRRLCVETPILRCLTIGLSPSRLQAAVC